MEDKYKYSIILILLRMVNIGILSFAYYVLTKIDEYTDIENYNSSNKYRDYIIDSCDNLEYAFISISSELKSSIFNFFPDINFIKLNKLIKAEMDINYVDLIFISLLSIITGIFILFTKKSDKLDNFLSYFF